MITHIQIRLIAALVLIGSAGAAQAQQASTSRDYHTGMNRALFQETRGTEYSQLPTGLCDISRKLMGPAGLYRVDQLVGVTEEVGGPGRGELDGFTYVELSLVKAWSAGAPSNPTVRMIGGPNGKQGRLRGWQIGLRQGELIGVVLGQPLPRNRNYYAFHNLGLFRQDPRTGGVTNGQLFTTEKRTFEEVGELVRRQRARPTGACPFDIYPTPETRGPRGVERDGDLQVQGTVDPATIRRARPARRATTHVAPTVRTPPPPPTRR